MSWHHARLDVSGTGGSIEDLGSKNGTLVTGALIAAPAALGDGDEIAIGETRLLFRTGTRTIETKTSRAGVNAG